MTEPATIAIIGAGNIGSALAHMLAGAGHRVRAWDHFDEVVTTINQRHRNDRFLPGVALDPAITATRSLAESATAADCALLCVPAAHVMTTAARLYEEHGAPLPLVCLSKGVDPRTRRPAMLALADAYEDAPSFACGGPCIAEELTGAKRGMLALAGPDVPLRERIATILRDSGQLLHVSDDRVGTAYGGVFKNVYAILVGYLSTGAATGDNLLGGALACCSAEAIALGTMLGCEPHCLAGPAGLGDLIATGLSGNSHNHSYGAALGRGERPAADALPEGARSVAHVCAWAEDAGVETPLADMVAALVAGEHIAHDRIEAALC
ncbi:MAG: NAD(P)H-dependent glycerol-3-phosphate dehydrogenase [Planctomycetota bacterium]